MSKQRSLWWLATKGEVHKEVFKTVEHWNIKQSQRSEDNLRNFRLYGNSEVLGLRLGEYQKLRSLNKLTMNVIQAAVDTAVSRIAKSKPKPMFLTEGGDFSLHRKAKNLEQYVMGNFYQMNHYEKSQMIFRDGCVFGDGIIHFFDNNGKIDSERVFPEEILVDEDEAIYGNPRQMHRIKFVPKAVMKAKFPKKKIIIESSSVKTESYMYDQYSQDMVMVVESWVLPSGPNEKDGRHSICVNMGDLLDENYAVNWFPFENWSWSKRLLGYWSQGISEQLTGIQIEINKLLKTIQLTMHLGSVPKIFLESGSRVAKSHLNNEVGGIIEYAGTRPAYEKLMGVPEELFIQLEKLYQRAFEIIGLSEMSVASRKPAGVDSGKALRTFHEIETERFSVVSQSWEEFHMRCAKKIIMISKEMSKVHKDMKVTSLGKKSLKVVKWADVNLEDDKYLMKAYPTNLLQDTPTGKIQDVKELISIGFLNKRQAYSLMDYPDIEAVNSLENAQVTDLEYTIESIIDEGKYSPPEPFQDLEYGVPLMQSAYLKYKRMNLEDFKLDMMAQWIDEALLLLNPPEPEPNIEAEEAALLENEIIGEQQLPEPTPGEEFPAELPEI